MNCSGTPSQRQMQRSPETQAQRDRPFSTGPVPDLSGSSVTPLGPLKNLLARQSGGMGATLVYDGDCGICDASVRLLALIGCQATAVTSRQWLVTHPDDAERCATAVLLVTDDGTVLEAEHAVAGALWLSQWPGPWLGRLIELPGVRVAAHALYRLVAANRARLSQALGLRVCALSEGPS